MNDRRTILGELNWIFTAITDTIAWTSFPPETFQKLFRLVSNPFPLDNSVLFSVKYFRSLFIFTLFVALQANLKIFSTECFFLVGSFEKYRQ